MSTKRVACAYDGESLLVDEAVMLAVEGEGALPFCGEDCRIRYMGRKKKAPTSDSGTPPRLEERVDRMESLLEKIAAKVLGDEAV